MINRLLIAGAITAIGGGLAVGVALGATDTVSLLSEGTVETGDDLAGLRPCPGADPIAQLRGGDRIFLTGRSEDGEWLQLRSPFAPDERLWIDADLVAADEDTSDLPEADCAPVELTITLPDGSTLVVPPSTTVPEGETTTTSTTTTTQPPAQAATTLPPAPTPTQPQTPGPQPSTSQPPPTQSSTTTTQPPDQTPPVLGNPTANPADIREDGDLGSTTCTPRTSQITVTASDPQSGISEVVMHWAVRDAHKVVVASGSTPMVLQSGAYRATLGPFHNDTLPALSANATVEVTLVATNGAGLSATTGTTVTLRDCSFG